MATILLIEEQPDLGLYETKLLEKAGHHVLRCTGGPTMSAACPMMRSERCPLAETADLIIFSCALFAPLRGRTYRGQHLLRSYRSHPDYSRKPMVIVSAVQPVGLPGTGPIALVQKFDDPNAIIAAVEQLLGAAGGRNDEGSGSDDGRRGMRRSRDTLQGDRRAARTEGRQRTAGGR